MVLQCLTLALPCLGLSFCHTLELRRLIAYTEQVKQASLLPEQEKGSEARRPTLPSHRVVERQDVGILDYYRRYRIGRFPSRKFSVLEPEFPLRASLCSD